MRSVCREAPQLLERVLKTRQRIVEHLRQLSELVPRICDRKPLGERFCADPPRRRRHRADGREKASRQKVAPHDRQSRGGWSPHRENHREGPECLAQRRLIPGHRDPEGTQIGCPDAMRAGIRGR